MQLTREIVTVWLAGAAGRDPRNSAGGVPVRLLWSGDQYRVSDTPTPLYGYIPEAPTHPLQPRLGWRFQGTNGRGETYIFDVHHRGRGEWELVAVCR